MQTILITGASSGIGMQLAKLLANEKCNLGLLSRRIDLLNDFARYLKETGSNILTVKCDVKNKDEIYNAVEIVKNSFGDIDIAIFNSGISIRSQIENIKPEEANEIFNVNTLGLIHCCEAVTPDFIKNRKGIIVGVSSLADGRGFPKSGLYCASKAAVTIYLESLRNELKKYNVKVLTVKPGFVRTPMTAKNDFKMPFLMDAEKAAQIILKGIKNKKRIIQFPLPTVFGAKLLKLMPDFLFEIIAKKI
jgi:short-subunit dehydrogenase